MAEAFGFATRDGAAALGLGGLTGTLQAGARADIVLVRIDGLHHMPRTPDPVATVVLQSRPGDIDTVIVNGVVRKRNGHLTNVDLGALRTRAQSSADHVAAAAANSADRAARSSTTSVYAAGVTRMTTA